MFAPSYFAPRYFAPRYFPNEGTGVVTIDPVVSADELLGQWDPTVMTDLNRASHYFTLLEQTIRDLQTAVNDLIRK